MKSTRKDWLSGAALLVVLLATALAYLPSLSGTWLFDDLYHIVNNEAVHIKELSFSALFKAAVKSPQPSRALANVSFALSYLASGQDAAAFHAANLGLHLLAATVCFFMLRALFFHPPPLRESALAAGRRSRGRRGFRAPSGEHPERFLHRAEDEPDGGPVHDGRAPVLASGKRDK
ncbi:MAG: hypothetical protein R6V10_10200 [bacterium]